MAGTERVILPIKELDKAITDGKDRIDQNAIGIAAVRIRSALTRKKNVYLLGNRNSNHLANQFRLNLMSAFEDNHLPLPGLIMRYDDTNALLVPYIKKHGFDHAMGFFIHDILQPHDIFMAISITGNSMNIVESIEGAMEKGACTILVAGPTGSKALEYANLALLATPQEFTFKDTMYHYVQVINQITLSYINAYMCHTMSGSMKTAPLD